MYEATEKFKELSRDNAHQGMDKVDFDKLLDGGKVENVPKRLIDEKYVTKITKKGAKNGSTS